MKGWEKRVTLFGKIDISLQWAIGGIGLSFVCWGMLAQVGKLRLMIDIVTDKCRIKPIPESAWDQGIANAKKKLGR